MGSGAPAFSTTDENAVLNPVTSAKEWGLGTAVGGLLGGGMQIAGNAVAGAKKNNAVTMDDVFNALTGNVEKAADTTAQNAGGVNTEYAATGENNTKLNKVDNAESNIYNEIVENGSVNGGAANERSPSDNVIGERVRAGQGGTKTDSSAENGRKNVGRGNISVPGIVLLSQESQNTLAQRGVVNVELQDYSANNAAFSAALDEARASDTVHGWAVTPKSAAGLTESNVRVFMDANGAAGFGIAPDGDIEAVFANKAKGAPRGTTKSTIPQAIANGGTKLDCYGSGLVHLYADYGFIPVARVEFNPEYANPGWTADKGSPYIYFMMHNGDSADTVVQNTGTYKQYSLAELEALPTYGKEEYDAAYAYRDRLIAEYGDKPTQTYLMLTGQGGIADADTGTVAGDLRTGGQGGGRMAGGMGGKAQGRAGWDWYNNNVARGEAPRLVQGSAEATSPHDTGGLGAANAGFDPYSSLQNQTDTFIPAGESPSRTIDVPAQDAAGRNISATARTAMEAQATPDAVVPSIEQAVADGDFSYDKTTNAETLANATEKIRQRGFALAFADWQKSLSKKATAETTAMGWALYNAAANSGDTKTALQILSDMSKYQRGNAQALQAQRILKRMSPEGQLYAAQRTVENLQDQLTEKYGDKAPELTIDEALAENFLQAETQDERDKALTEIYKSIGRQMPASWKDKWDAWRYLAMLGNLRTHNRNILGNAGFAPIRGMKNLMATGMESAVDLLTGGAAGRTKAVLNYASSADRALFQSAWSDYAHVQEQIMSGGKFDNGVNVNQAIQSGRRIFGKPLKDSKSPLNLLMNGVEGARRVNSFLLDAEDAMFSKPAYARALAGWLKANGVTVESASGAQLDSARAYAIREAQRATYRDTNAFSAFVSSIGFKNPDNAVKKGVNMLVEGTLPFKKTPANILVRGVEYSPIGLWRGLTWDLYKVHQGEKTAAEAIDDIAAGLTGSTLAALGLYAVAQGFIRGGWGDDDKQAAQDDLTGHQKYALEIGGKSITLDWLAPEALPFFTGVELYYSLMDGEKSVWDVFKSVGSSMEPMLEMSMLQSLNDLFEAGRYSKENAMVRVLATSAANYFTQAIPTSFGQLARTIDGTRRSTYIDPNSEVPDTIQYLLQNAAGKIPFLSSMKQPYVDAYGRQEREDNVLKRAFNNFVNPAYTSEINETEIDKELQRLYDAGFKNVFADKGEKTFSLQNGEKKSMTAEEYTTYSMFRGNAITEMLTSLFDSSVYSGFSDQEKADAIGDIYEVATSLAKAEVSDYEPEGTAVKIQEAEKAGVSLGEWFRARYAYTEIDADESLSNTQKATRFADWLVQNSYGSAQQDVLREQMKYWQMVPAEAARYDNMVASGLSSEDALEITDIISGLAPPKGKNAVQEYQMYDAILDITGLSDTQKYTAMAEYESLSSGDRSKVQTAEAAGVPIDDFAEAMRLAYDYKNNYDDNDRLDGGEVAELLQFVDADKDVKDILWALLAPSSTETSKNNPYGNTTPKALEWIFAD